MALLFSFYTRGLHSNNLGGMKKVVGLVLMIALLCVGCLNQKGGAEFSEITFYYFEGESNGDYALLCVGEREEPYKKDGVTANKFDFSLITLTLKQGYPNYILPATIEINGAKQQVYLELIGTEYTIDLGRKLAPTDEIRLVYNDNCIDFCLQSPEIEYSEAVRIGEKYLDKFLEGEMQYERYLRVLTHSLDGQKFWGYSVFTAEGRELVAVIDSSTGEVIKG